VGSKGHFANEKENKQFTTKSKDHGANGSKKKAMISLCKRERGFLQPPRLLGGVSAHAGIGSCGC
jgi:hypothetical protein